MAANVETMFYVRETPWHRLGIKVEEALDSKEALEKSGLNWMVEQHNVIVDERVMSKYKANVRNSDQTVLGIVSDRYKIVQNSEAFQFTDNLLKADVRYETAGALQEGKKVWMLAKMPETNILGDNVEPYLVFTNSHDGTGAIKVALTPIRVVCQNTLNLALNGAKRSWSTKHMGNMEEKMLEAQRTLELASIYIDKFEEEAERLASKKITDIAFQEFLNSLFPIPEDATNRKIDNVKTVRANLKLAYNAPDLANFKGTAYGVINAVSDMVTHSTPLRNTDTYREGLFNKVIEGHPIIDKAYELIKVA
jgi:phage/plasmid-like protein (TIGR03299 family)